MRILGYFSTTKCFREQTSLGKTVLTTPRIYIALKQVLLLQPTLKCRKLSSVIIIIIMIIIIIIIIIVSFMRCIYTYIPETNHVPREHIVAAILSLLFMVPISLVPALVLLYFYVSTFRSMCAVPNMAVFCSFLTSWFPGILLTYFLNDFEMVPVAPIITGIALVLHSTCAVFLL
jgi:hypothetical protein